MKTFLGKHVSVFTFQRTDISRESDVIQYRGYPKDLSFRLRTEIYDFFRQKEEVCLCPFFCKNISIQWYKFFSRSQRVKKLHKSFHFASLAVLLSGVIRFRGIVDSLPFCPGGEK